jgi:hypothetical protein
VPRGKCPAVKAVVGYPGYFVTSDGDVYSCIGGWPRRLRLHTDQGGYSRVQLGRDSPSHSVHRLVLTAFIGPCPKGHGTRHLDGNPANNYLANLCWGTQVENAQDRKRHGREMATFPPGEKHPNSKLTDQQAAEIKALLQIGRLSRTAIAIRYGVHYSQISRIAHGHRWRHVALAA